MAFASTEATLPCLVEDLGISSELALLEKAWNAEVGGLGAYARIRAVDRHALVIDVDSPVAKQELSLRRRELLRRLNAHFSHPILKNITLRTSDAA